MQVAAMNPQYVSQEEIPAAVLEKEKAIRIEQAKTVGQARGGDPARSSTGRSPSGRRRSASSIRSG